ncbi:hypothetical protein Hanom_Chr15g01401571 [Helianthus anomalus]
MATMNNNSQVATKQPVPTPNTLDAQSVLKRYVCLFNSSCPEFVCLSFIESS